MKKIRLFICLLCGFCIGIFNSVVGQTAIIKGSVFEQGATKIERIPLPGATVLVNGSGIGTVTGAEGNFEMSVSQNYPVTVIVSYIGYKADTTIIENSNPVKIYLARSVELNEVTIEGRQDATMISTIMPLNVEQVTQKELLKAACCNLSESFETNASVNVAYSDAVTGAKEIQMLGLSGIYSQIMTENIPAVRGLSAAYGLGFIPGPWMESIQITKGSGSVANGYESATGLINVEFLKPDKADKFYLNLYGASSGNMELNAYQTMKVNDNLNTMIMLHGENMQTKWDHQDDGFLDMPLVTQGNILNRWSYYDGKKYEAQFGVKGIIEKRRGGQLKYDFQDFADTTSGYGVQIETQRIEVFSKNGLVFPATPWKSAGVILSGTFHDQQSYFGLKSYDAQQLGFYGSLIYMSIIGTTDHKWKAGLDLRYDDFEETFLDFPYNHSETVPGAYFEYTWNRKDKLGVVAGSRIDYHSDHGWFYTPRLHVKYNFTQNIIWRASAGRNFRTANIFADNIALMATARDWFVKEQLEPEIAWNYGTNVTAKFQLFYRSGSLSADYYITDFRNQVIVDTYSSEDFIYFYNLKGESTSRSFQVALNYEVFKRFDLRVAFKNDDVVADFNGIATQKPLVAANKALANVAYETKNALWKFDFTMHYTGESQLNNASELHSSLHQGHSDSQVKGSKSPEFVTFNTQVTRIFKNWEVYTGCENISDFRQEMPVIGAENPFGSEFDATNIWGPIMGRKIYLGFRYSIKQKKS
jgi:outer membrane receptor for ferrienterochelin and colicins